MGLGWLTESWIGLSQLFLVFDGYLFNSCELFLFCEIISFWFPFRNYIFTAFNRIFCFLERSKRCSLWRWNKIASFIKFPFKCKTLFVKAFILHLFLAYCQLLGLLPGRCGYHGTEAGKGFAWNNAALVWGGEIFFHESLLISLIM